MGVSCCEQETSRDEVTDTNESLGISWNRQGQSQPWSLARHVGKAPSQLCVGREDSGECRSCQEPMCPPCSGSALGPGQSLSLQRKAKLRNTPPKTAPRALPVKPGWQSCPGWKRLTHWSCRRAKDTDQGFCFPSTQHPQKSAFSANSRMSLSPLLSHFFFSVDFLLWSQLWVSF